MLLQEPPSLGGGKSQVGWSTEEEAKQEDLRAHVIGWRTNPGSSGWLAGSKEGPQPRQGKLKVWKTSQEVGACSGHGSHSGGHTA